MSPQWQLNSAPSQQVAALAPSLERLRSNFAAAAKSQEINRSIAIVPAWAACGAVWLASAQARPSAGRGRCYRSYY